MKIYDRIAERTRDLMSIPKIYSLNDLTLDTLTTFDQCEVYYNLLIISSVWVHDLKNVLLLMVLKNVFITWDHFQHEENTSVNF